MFSAGNKRMYEVLRMIFGYSYKEKLKNAFWGQHTEQVHAYLYRLDSKLITSIENMRTSQKTMTVIRRKSRRHVWNKRALHF